uniref:Uncharacterized protein n=1 Tax=viral metagenome TaxID=1070528 RepID=A0A6M3K800_9ZZZZ
MMQETLVDAIHDEFFARVETKTSWGKEKLKQLYLEVERDIALKFLLTAEQGGV